MPLSDKDRIRLDLEDKINQLKDKQLNNARDLKEELKHILNQTGQWEAMSGRINASYENIEKSNKRLVNLATKIKETELDSLDAIKDYIKEYEKFQLLNKQVFNLKEKFNELDALSAGTHDENIEREKRALKTAIQRVETQKELLDATYQFSKEIDENGDTLEKLTKEYKKSLDLNKENTRVSNENSRILKEQTKELEEHNKKWDKRINTVKNYWNLAKGVFNVGKKELLNWSKYDEAVSKVGRTFYNNNSQNVAYRKQMYDTASELSRRYGVTYEELTKYQQGYATETGRAVQLSKDNYGSIAAISKQIGEENAIGYLSEVDKLGISIEDATDQISSLMNVSKKTGVTAAKASQNFTKNLKLAQSYTFRNGVDGIEKMTVLSTKLRLDMDSIARIADNISTPEGAIESAAKLQVLGGSFANLANPMALLNEGLNDMEGLTERIVKMFSGKGMFNTKTGQVDIGSMDKTFIKRAAEALGADANEMLNLAYQRVRQNAISKQISVGAGFDDETKSLIESIAQFNKKTGQFEVTYTDQSGEQVTKEVRRLTALEAKQIKPQQNQEQNIRDIAASTQSMNDILKGMAEKWNIQRASFIEPVAETGKQSARNGWIGSAFDGISNLAGPLALAAGLGKVGFDFWTMQRRIREKPRFPMRSKGPKIGDEKVLEDGTRVKYRKFKDNSTNWGYGDNGRKVTGKRLSEINAKKPSIWQRLRGKGKATGKLGLKAGGKGGWAGMALMAGSMLLPSLLGGNDNEPQVTDSSIKDVYGESNGITEILTDSRDILSKILSVMTGGKVDSNNLSSNYTSDSGGISNAIDNANGTIQTGAYIGSMIPKLAERTGASQFASNSIGRTVGGKAIAGVGGKLAGKLATGVAKGGPLGLAGVGVDLARMGLNATGIVDEGSFADKSLGVAGSALSYAATGAMLGSVIPGLGTAVGGAIGAGVGALKGLYDENKEIVNEFVSNTWNKTKGFIGNAWESVKGIGRTAISSIPVIGQAAANIIDPNVAQNQQMQMIFSTPLNINLNGNITLSVPNGKQTSIDSNDLLNNPSFIKELSQILIKQINSNFNGGRVNMDSGSVRRGY